MNSRGKRESGAGWTRLKFPWFHWSIWAWDGPRPHLPIKWAERAERFSLSPSVISVNDVIGPGGRFLVSSHISSFSMFNAFGYIRGLNASRLQQRFDWRVSNKLDEEAVPQGLWPRVDYCNAYPAVQSALHPQRWRELSKVSSTLSKPTSEGTRIWQFHFVQLMCASHRDSQNGKSKAVRKTFAATSFGAAVTEVQKNSQKKF